MKTLFGTLLLVFSLTVFITLIVMGINFNRNCGGYLKRAADSNSIEMAKTELSRAINYLELRGDTLGYTSVIYKTPDEDIAFWYHNIKSCWRQMNEININTTELEKTNVLMKLRETLLDNKGETGDQLTKPNGISKFPNNVFWALLSTLATLSLIGACVLFFFAFDDSY
jgi:hypothetical protein